MKKLKQIINSRFISTNAILLLIGSSVASSQEEIKEANKQNSVTSKSGSEPMDEVLPDLGLNDEDFWTNPFKTRVKTELGLVRKKQEALIVAAPKEVSFQDRETLPVIVLRTGGMNTLAKLPFESNAVLVAQNTLTAEVYANMAVVSDAVPPAPYSGPPLTGMGGEGFNIDARRMLKLPWQRGNYDLYIILRDQMSLKVTTAIGKGGYVDPAVTAFVAESQNTPADNAIWPPLSLNDDGSDGSSQLPNYKESKETPAIPHEIGVELNMGRVIEKVKNTKCEVFGSFKLPIKASQRYSEKNTTLYKPTAIVPITLLFTGADSAAPYLFKLKVPVYGELNEENNTELVTGYFSVDLCSLAPLDSRDETYFVYVFAKGYVGSPTVVSFSTK